MRRTKIGLVQIVVKVLLGRKYKVSPQELKFIGEWNYGPRTLLLFNIEDKRHRQYKSTVSWPLAKKI